MTTHSGHNFEANADAEASLPWVKTIQNPFKFLGERIKNVNDFVKEYAGLSVGVFAAVATVAGGYFAYEATIESAKIQSTTSLKAYVDSINTLNMPRESDVTNPTFEKEIETLLKSNSFQALRSLRDREKGIFVRFLAEKELIRNGQEKISLAGADLRDVDLEDAWLPDVNLRKTYILGSNLINANLTRANLIEVDLQGADLTGAVLTDADFTGADLTKAHIDIDEATRQGANFCNATMPDGRKGDCL